MLIPKANSDLYDVDGEVKKAIRFLPMSNVAQVLSITSLKPGCFLCQAERGRA